MMMTMLMMDRVVIVPLVRVMMKRHVRRKAMILMVVMMKRHVRRKAMILMVVMTNTVPKRMRMIVMTPLNASFCSFCKIHPQNFKQRH